MGAACHTHGTCEQSPPPYCIGIGMCITTSHAGQSAMLTIKQFHCELRTFVVVTTIVDSCEGVKFEVELGYSHVKSGRGREIAGTASM